MKAGYSEAAWRLFQPSFDATMARAPRSSARERSDRMSKPTTTGAPKSPPDPGVLPGTPAGKPAKGPGIVPGTPDEKRDQGREPSGGRRS